MKILLTTIFRGDSEYDEIERMLKSIMPHVDGLCSVITSNSAPRLKALIKRYNGQYRVISPATTPDIFDEQGGLINFAAARNICFLLAEEMQKEGKYDWWTWADADDIVVNANELKEVGEKALEYKVDLVFFSYWYSIKLNPDGSFSEKNVEIEHLRERLIKPNMFKWVSRLHEIALPKDGNYEAKSTVYGYDPKEGRGCVWAHLTTHDRVMKAMERNIKILEIQAKEEQHKDPRTVFYLAKTYYDVAGMGKPEYYQLADLLIDEYLDGPNPSGWAEERASALEYKAKIRMNTGNHRGAIEMLHKSIEEYGDRNMPYLLLAKEYTEVKDFAQADFWLDLALRMKPPDTRTTIGNPMEIKFLAAGLKTNEALRKNDINGALEWLRTRNALGGIKDDPIEKELEDLQLMNKAAEWVFNYAKWLKDKHPDKLQHIVDALPPELGREMFANIIANDYRPPKKWGEKEIVYYASWGGDHFEGWSAKSLSKGIGGSETAVIELARRWAKKGYKVTVFGDPREDEGEIDGVLYKPWYTINWNDEFNVLILWRSPHLLDKDIKARKLYMDLHDVASALDWTPERIKKIDKVFFKSKFHRSMCPNIPEEKVRILSNGI